MQQFETCWYTNILMYSPQLDHALAFWGLPGFDPTYLARAIWEWSMTVVLHPHKSQAGRKRALQLPPMIRLERAVHGALHFWH